MPLYFFVLQYPDGELDDPNGTNLPTAGAAFEYAQRIVRDLKKDGGYDDPGIVMVVKDEAQRIVFSVPF